VLIFQPRAHGTSKLRLPWEGPYEVLKRNSDLNYLVRKVGAEQKPKTLIIHLARMKRYHGGVPL